MGFSRQKEIQKLIAAIGRPPSSIERQLIEETVDCLRDMIDARAKSKRTKHDNQIQGYLNSAQRAGKHRLQILKALGLVGGKPKDDGLSDMFKGGEGKSNGKAKSKPSDQKRNRARTQTKDPISELLSR